MLDIVVPVMGESVAEGSIGSWSKKAGDAVKKDELLVEIETDKVALEVVSPADGPFRGGGHCHPRHGHRTD
jgi:2-oxoglutarate dehydrogenase E2 component (dihydrolipoamide succinyltransferase)